MPIQDSYRAKEHIFYTILEVGEEVASSRNEHLRFSSELLSANTFAAGLNFTTKLSYGN